MTDALVLLRLRRFLLAVSATLYLGTVAELWLVGHTETVIQLIPFALCGLGLIIVIVALLYPRRATLLALRACAVVVLSGGLYGVYEHVAGNIAFLSEIQPNAKTREIVMGAVGGANPLLAPGILALAAVLAVAASYRHPALGRGDDSDRSPSARTT
jgi:hypothetical protein